MSDADQEGTVENRYGRGGGQEDQHIPVGNVRLSRFRAAVPQLPSCLAATCFVLNLIPSGWGTLLGAFLVLCYPTTELLSTKQAFCINVGVFCFQLLLTPLLLVGWVWSVMWGCAIMATSGNRQLLRNEDDNPTADK